MESRTLHTIQVFVKVGKILSAIMYYCSLVSAILCLVGVACIGIPGGIKIGGVNIYSMFVLPGDVSFGAYYSAMVTGFVFCAATCIVSKCAHRYFEKELADGTPFTSEGAHELMKLGICTLVAPIAAIVTAEICNAILSNYFVDVVDVSFDSSISVVLGVVIIAASVICKLGAEQESKAN